MGMQNWTEKRMQTRAAVSRVVTVWQDVPQHVRIMGAKYIEPAILAVLEIEGEIINMVEEVARMSAELEAMRARMGEGVAHG